MTDWKSLPSSVKISAENLKNPPDFFEFLAGKIKAEAESLIKLGIIRNKKDLKGYFKAMGLTHRPNRRRASE